MHLWKYKLHLNSSLFIFIHWPEATVNHKGSFRKMNSLMLQQRTSLYSPPAMSRSDAACVIIDSYHLGNDQRSQLKPQTSTFCPDVLKQLELEPGALTSMKSLMTYISISTLCSERVSFSIFSHPHTVENFNQISEYVVFIVYEMLETLHTCWLRPEVDESLRVCFF